MNKKQKNKKLLYIFFIIIFFIILFFIFGNLFINKKVQASKTVNLTFFNQKPEISTQYQDLINLYEKEHQNVNINLTTVGSGNGASALQAKFVSGDPPDIVMLGGLPDISRYKKQLLPLNDMGTQKKVIPSLKTGSKYKNKNYGIPVDLEGYGWAYNKKVFRKANINPNKIKDFNDFKKTVTKLNDQKRKLNLSGVFGFDGASINTPASFMAQFWSQPFKNNLYKAYTNKRLKFYNEKKTIKYLNLVRQYNVKPILSVEYDPAISDLLYNGKVAMIPQGNWVIAPLAESKKSFPKKNLGMLPFYVKEKPHLLTGSSWYYGVTKTDPLREKAAKKFINWIFSSPKSQKIMVQQMKLVPAIKNFPLKKLQDPVSKQVYRDGISKHNIEPIHKEFPNGFTQETLTPNIQKYFVHKISWSKLKKDTRQQYYKLRDVQENK